MYSAESVCRPGKLISFSFFSHRACSAFSEEHRISRPLSEHLKASRTEQVLGRLIWFWWMIKTILWQIFINVQWQHFRSFERWITNFCFWFSVFVWIYKFMLDAIVWRDVGGFMCFLLTRPGTWTYDNIVDVLRVFFMFGKTGNTTSNLVELEIKMKHILKWLLSCSLLTWEICQTSFWGSWCRSSRFMDNNIRLYSCCFLLLVMNERWRCFFFFFHPDLVAVWPAD